MSEADTIYAPATVRGRAAVAVVRVSGPRAGEALLALTGRPPPPPRRAVLRPLRAPDTGEALDEALVLWMPGPASFTGEDSAEFHCHGGIGVVEGVLAALGRRPGLRLARPGEFSRRAVATGRLDLASAEALADLVDAETAAQRRQALRLAGGALAAQTEAWRGALLAALAGLEAGLDFSDERDVADRLSDAADTAALGELRFLRGEMDAALRAGRAGERLREGLVVALVGAPNAGKSSLLNALAGRDAAIVSPVPGTTRDAIEVRMEADGLPLLLVDTAGLRDTDDPVEREGVARARRAAARADLVLRLRPADAANETGPTEGTLDPLSPDVVAGDGRPAIAPPSDERADPPLVIEVVSKADLARAGPGRPPPGNNAAFRPLAVSAVTGEGLDALRAALTDAARARLAGAESALVVRARQREALHAARDALDRAVAALESGLSPEFAAEDLRVTLRRLDWLTGRLALDGVLDRVFSTFCIGK